MRIKLGLGFFYRQSFSLLRELEEHKGSMRASSSPNL
jgi:hypothetical protein